MATIPDTFVAVPDKVPVIVFAEKFPLPSLATIAFPVFKEVAVVAVLLTLPELVIVANLVSDIAVPLHTPVVIVPTLVKLGKVVKLEFDEAVIFVAVPDKVPVNPSELTEVNPVTEVTVPPNVIVVEPKVVVLVAN